MANFVVLNFSHILIQVGCLYAVRGVGSKAVSGYFLYILTVTITTVFKLQRPMNPEWLTPISGDRHCGSISDPHVPSSSDTDPRSALEKGNLKYLAGKTFPNL